MKTSTQLLTVLLPVYNNAQTLERTLESLRQQTFKNFHILAIDDGSTDATRNILQNWQQHFGEEHFTLVINQKNIGLTLTLNRGLELITTPYTARIDADDWWHPDKLALQIEFFNIHHDYGIIGTWYENHGRHGVRKLRLPETDQSIKSSLLKQNPFAHSAIMFRTELVKKAGGYNPHWRYGQDYELWLRLMSQTKFANIPQFLCYRTADDTLTARKQRDQMFLCVKAQLLYLRKYDRPWYEYRFILTPLLVALAPEWLRSLKRHYL